MLRHCQGQCWDQSSAPVLVLQRIIAEVVAHVHSTTQEAVKTQMDVHSVIFVVLVKRNVV